MNQRKILKKKSNSTDTFFSEMTKYLKDVIINKIAEYPDPVYKNYLLLCNYCILNS